MSRIARIGGSALLLLAAFGVAPGTASAACAPASVHPEQSRVAPGGTLTAVGDSWSAGCHDTPCESGGCSGCDLTNSPTTGISLALVGNGGQRIPLADGIAAGEDLSFRIEVVIPPDTELGRYRLLAEGEGTEADRPLSIVNVIAFESS